jgi:UDP-N-acetylmuramyl-tripeptide synthetase
MALFKRKHPRKEKLLPKEKLSELDWATLKQAVADHQYIGVTSDSREVKPGFLYVAVTGLSQDGHEFIPVAVAQGAKAVVGERKFESGIPYVQVKDSRWALADLASAFYGNPSHALKIAAVTGTSGKTTTTYILESILQAAGHKVGVIGTVNFRFGKKIFPSTHTTPGAVELQKLLSEMKADGCTHLVMEVSSHALKQHRVARIEFDVMAFTNLSPEHLDFHSHMEDYFRSKAMLFREFFESAQAAGKKPVRVVNAEDTFGNRLLGEIGGQNPGTHGESLKAYGIGLSGLKDSLDGISGNVGEIQSIQSRLVGRFNVYNLLCAIEMSKALGVSSDHIREGVKRLTCVPGRLERIENNGGIHAFVDYAHKSDALEKVLTTLKALKQPQQRIITVFGCGGDRDQLKRPVMGKIAAEYSDEVILTWDNPRTENPEKIIGQIVAGMPANSYKIEPDRRKAIYLAVKMARPGDLVLVAGKGHEDYQIIGTTKTHFDDREVLGEALIS